MSEPQARPPGEGARTPPDPSPAAIRRQLDRILQSSVFRTARRRRDMLRFLVEETLTGRGDRLKGYAIATQALGRPEDFDPRADPVVRIEARRLRRDLDLYYAGPGRHDRLVISIPKGRYLPSFDRREGDRGEAADAAEAHEPPPGAPPAAAPGRPGRAPARLGWGRAALVSLLVLAALAIGIDRLRPSGAPVAERLRLPSVLVEPLHAAEGSDLARLLAEGITQELVSNLMRFPDFRLFLARPGGGGSGAADLDRLMAEEAPYLVTGEIVADDGRFRLSAHLSDAETGRVIWSETYARDLSTSSLVGVQADLAGEIASALGQPTAWCAATSSPARTRMSPRSSRAMPA